MQAFERQDCQAAILIFASCIVAILIKSKPKKTSLSYIKLHGSCCNFSFINNPRRNCVIPKALLSKLDGVKCIINVKTSAVFKVGILQCNAVDLFQIYALKFSILCCNFINTLIA
jgi:hypothetical protein